MQYAVSVHLELVLSSGRPTGAQIGHLGCYFETKSTARHNQAVTTETHMVTHWAYLVFPPFLKSCLGCAKSSCGKMRRSRGKQGRHCTYNLTHTLTGIHCCSGIAISVTHSDCVFVALGIHHVMCMCHNIICGLPGCTIFFHIFS